MLLRAGAAALISSFTLMADARAEECGREAFAAVVAEANAELTALNAAHKQRFQKKLQALKSHAGWSDGEFVAKATPFVKDQKIAGFDTQNKELLAHVPQLGASSQTVASLAGAAPSFDPPADKRCGMVEELRGLMSTVIENSRAKWTYMIGKVDAALNATADAPAGK